MNRRIILKRMSRNPFFMVGIVFAILITLIVVLGPLFLDYDANKESLDDRFTPPQWFSQGLKGHILGTDELGRDLLMRILMGGQVSLLIAVIVVLVQNFIGLVLGIISGYFGGITDTIIMRLSDFVLAIPLLLLAITVIAVVGASIFNLIAVLSLSTWVTLCKVIRNNVRVYKNQEFVSAARVFGAGKLHIMFSQIFPNVTTNLLIIGSQGFGTILLTEASLSFLNLGVQIPNPSWGNMINTGRNYLTLHPWVAIVPGVALMLTVFSLNFLGNGLRDVLDPRENKRNRGHRRRTAKQSRV